MQIKSPTIKNLLVFSLGLFLFAIDRLFKYLAINNYFQHNEIIKGTIYLDFFKNENISFSIPTGNMAALVISIIILVLFIIYYILKLRKNSQLSILLYSLGFNSQLYTLFSIFLGTISNIIDRIKYGYVIDYINFININVLNIADILIFLGLTIFTLKEIKWFQK